VALLAYVDRAHGNLSGPATRRILEREHSEYGQAAYQRLAGISVAHLLRLRNTAAYRKRNTTLSADRGRRQFRSASGASHGRKVSPDICASTPCIRATRTAARACITSMPWTKSRNGDRWQRHRKSPNCGCCRCWRAILQQFPFVIRGFHSDNGSEFINYTVARLLGKLLIEQTPIASAPFRRQRSGGGQEWSHHPQAHRLRLHQRKSTLSPWTQFYREHLNPYVNFPSSLRRTQSRHRSQRQAPQNLPALGHTVRTLAGVTGWRELSAARDHVRGTGAVTPLLIRHRSRNLPMQQAKRKLLGRLKGKQTA